MRLRQFPPSTPISATGETDMFQKFDLGGVMHELWLAPTPHGYHLHILDGWSGPGAFADEGAGRGSLTVAGASEAVAFPEDGAVVQIRTPGRALSLCSADSIATLIFLEQDDSHNVARPPMPRRLLPTPCV